MGGQGDHRPSRGKGGLWAENVGGGLPGRVNDTEPSCSLGGGGDLEFRRTVLRVQHDVDGREVGAALKSECEQP